MKYTKNQKGIGIPMFLRWALSCTMLFIPMLMTAQHVTIKGTVVDNLGESLPGVNIVEKGTLRGTITDIDGNFSLDASKENAVLVFSYVGYIPQEVTATGKKELKVTLKDDSKNIEEVVVVGYGTARKKDLTGSVVRLNTAELLNQAPNNVQDLMRGNVAGLNVGFDASAKGGGDLQIRGPKSITANAAPLVVLDGVIYNGTMADINPQDIESIDVLKDASSAAVYGSRSAAGVIVVTTKKGSAVGKPVVRFSGTVGAAMPTQMERVYNPEEYLFWRSDLMQSMNSTKDYRQYLNPNQLPSDLSVADWLKMGGSPADMDPMEAWVSRLSMTSVEQQNWKDGKSVNWKPMIYQTGIRQDYTASVSGRTEHTSYYISGGYTNNQGVVKYESYNTYRARINFDTKITNFLSIGTNVQFADRDDSNLGANKLYDGYDVPGRRTADAGRLKNNSPWGSEYDANGEYALYPTGQTESRHPWLDRKYTDRLDKNTTISAAVYAKVSLPYGFSIQSTFSPFYTFRNYFNHQSAAHPDWAALGGKGLRAHMKTYSWQLDNLIKWNKTFGDHKFDFTGLINAEKYQYWESVSLNEAFSPNDNLGYHQLGSGTKPSMTSKDEVSTSDALMARILYTFKDRYMLTATIRRDGYSAFGQKNPRATFPSVALGWVFTDEEFVKVPWLDYGKLRFSVGENGNRGVGRYDAMANLTSNLHIFADPNGVAYNTAQLYVSRMMNRNLRWERTLAYNVGIDFSVLKERLSGSIEGYYMQTKDLLITRKLPNITGFDEVMSNMGQLDNTGFELTLNSVNITNKDFTWKSTATFSLNRNKIISLYGNMIDIVDANGNVIGQKEADDFAGGRFIGYSKDEIYDYKITGVWQLGQEDEAKKYGVQPGDFRIYDPDDSGKLEREDKQFLGSKVPLYRATLRNDFSYKGFDLSIMMYGNFGHYGEYNNAKNRDGFLDRTNDYVRPYWTRNNPSNEYARIYSNEGGVKYSVWKNRSFIRLSNISLGYNIPSVITKKWQIQNLRLNINAQNVAVWAPSWKYWDPEKTDGAMPTYITFGVDITL